MKSELSFKTVECSTYERLLQRCMATAEVWASRRQEICEVVQRSVQACWEMRGLPIVFVRGPWGWSEGQQTVVREGIFRINGTSPARQGGPAHVGPSYFPSKNS